MKIAKQLKGFRDFNERRVDDDDNDGNDPRPPRMPPFPLYDFLLYNTLLPSPLMMSDSEIEQTPTSREKVAK